MVIVKSPMPAKVVRISVNVGDHVKEGDELIVIESMKMEMIISAPVSGVVRKIMVEEKQTLPMDFPVCEIE
jgi:biotin carboxyl carrier protein